MGSTIKMRITSRIALGLFLMAALLIGALAYQLSLVGRLQEVTQELSRTNLEAARISIQLIEGVEGVREFAAKASALRDVEYRLQWTEWEEAVDAALLRLAVLELSGEEALLRGRIESEWRGYRATSPGLWLDPSRLPEVEDRLFQLRQTIEGLIAANTMRVADRAASSAATGEEARLVAQLSAGGALLLAGSASLFLFLSISGPLRRLARGTRELAEGRFEHRLEVSGPADLAGVARDFNHMAERLDELEELKRDFVSHVSHELKSPLAAVHETVEILLDELPGTINDRQRHLLELARRSSTRLSVMIGDLLETSRHEAGAATYDPEPHRLSEIVHGVLEELQPVAAERQITLRLQEAPEGSQLFCDGDRIREVVANLVGNALKFSPEGSRVEILLARPSTLPQGAPPRRAAALVREKPPFILLSVEDEGEGIPDEHKPRIFEKFHQVAGRQRIRGQGVGLGLAITRRIVEAHGGAVWVEDRPAGGSVFHVVLPAGPSRWREEARRHAEGSARGAAPAPEKGGSGRGVPVPTRAILLLLAPFLATACASVPGFRSDGPSVEVAAVPPAPGPAVEPITPEAPAVAPRMERAFGLLEGGSFQESAEAFQAILVLPLTAEERAEARWGMALIRLFPASPLRDREAALRELTALETEAPQGILRLQAAWARATLMEDGDLRRRVDEQDALIRQLNETLEALRRIDLDRRPSGGAAPPGGDFR